MLYVDRRMKYETIEILKKSLKKSSDFTVGKIKDIIKVVSKYIDKYRAGGMSLNLQLPVRLRMNKMHSNHECCLYQS